MPVDPDGRKTLVPRAPQSPADNTALLSEIIETQNDIAAVELDRATLMEMIVERAQKLTHAGGAALEFVEKEHLVFQTASGMLVASIGEHLPMNGSLSGVCATTGEIIYCRDTDLDPRVAQTVARRLGIRSMILVPLGQNGIVSGVLKVASAKPNGFDDQSVLALRLMGSLLGSALAHASEFEIKKKLLAERTAALSARRESEERFRSAFDHAAIGKALVDLTGRWIEVNHSLCRIVGYTETELLASRFQAITHPDDLDADLTFTRRLIGNEIDDYQMVKRYFHKHGHIVWAQLSVSLVRDETGKPLYFISQIQDISQRHRAEEALRASEDEYRAMFELAGVAKIKTDLKTGRFLRVNRKFCEMIGYTADEALCLTFESITPPEDRAISRAAADRMLRGEISEHTLEKRYVRKDGTIVWISLNAAVLRDSQGNPSMSVATVQDITERKRIEALESDRRKVLEMVVKGRSLDDILSQLSLAVQRQIPGAATAIFLLREGRISVLASALPAAMQAALQEHATEIAVKLSAFCWDSPHNCSVTFLRTDPQWEILRQTRGDVPYATCWAIPIQSSEQVPLGLVLVFSNHHRPPAELELQTLKLIETLATISIEHSSSTQLLAHRVRHDPLTGLPNRVLFEDQFQRALGMSHYDDNRTALMILDIDNFKNINDTLGHQAGDHLLQLFAQRVQLQLCKGDTLARLGGDEFAIVLPEVAGIKEATAIAERIKSALTEPFELPGVIKIHATTSMGLAVAEPMQDDSVSLQKRADAALYRAKAQGRNRYSF